MILPTITNIRKIISETQEEAHPVNVMILALIEKNVTSPHRNMVDVESLLIDMRYSISLINRAANQLEKAVENNR